MTVLKESKINYVNLALSVSASLALFALYLYFLFYYSSQSYLGPTDGVAAIIFYTLVLRSLGLLFIPSLRRLATQIKIIIVSFEAFILSLLIGLEILAGNGTFAPLIANVLTAWIGASLIVLTPYAIYELAVMMLKGTTITGLVVTVAPILAVALYLAGLVSRVSNPITGLTGFGTNIVQSFSRGPSFGNGVSNPGSDSVITASAVLFFVIIIVYITLSMNQSITELAGVPKYHYALALVLVGIVLAYLWTQYAASRFAGNLIYIFTIPAILIPLILWVISHG